MGRRGWVDVAAALDGTDRTAVPDGVAWANRWGALGGCSRLVSGLASGPLEGRLVDGRRPSLEAPWRVRWTRPSGRPVPTSGQPDHRTTRTTRTPRAIPPLGDPRGATPDGPAIQEATTAGGASTPGSRATVASGGRGAHHGLRQSTLPTPRTPFRLTHDPVRRDGRIVSGALWVGPPADRARRPAARRRVAPRAYCPRAATAAGRALGRRGARRTRRPAPSAHPPRGPPTAAVSAVIRSRSCATCTSGVEDPCRAA